MRPGLSRAINHGLPGPKNGRITPLSLASSLHAFPYVRNQAGWKEAQRGAAAALDLSAIATQPGNHRPQLLLHLLLLLRFKSHLARNG